MKSINKQGVAYLLERGIDIERAKEFGHKTVTKKEGKNLIGQEISGLAIAYHDIEKQVVGYRIRPFESDWDKCPELKDYYLGKNGELPKFLSKPKKMTSNLDEQRVNKAYFSLATDWKLVMKRTSTDVIITEGELKAESACLQGVPTIALAGVNCLYNKLKLNNASEGESEFLPELEWFLPEGEQEYRKSYWQNKNVGLCFDSDINHKWQVKVALLKLAKELKKRGANPFFILLPTEPDGEKNGIDDFICRHGIDSFKTLVEQFKILQAHPTKSLLRWNPKKEEYSLGQLEPVVSIKGVMSWTLLRDKLAYREGFGWYNWTGKYWRNCSEAKICHEIQQLRYHNAWLDVSDKTVFDDIKAAIAVEEHDWNPTNYIAFQNGYLHTDTGKLEVVNKELRLTSILPFNYNLEAKCPHWLDFLQEALGNNQDWIEYARAWFRWILSPKSKNYPIEGTLWLTGPAGTGKGTFLSILQALVGEENYAAVEPSLIGDPTHLYSLVDKKLSINSDATGFIKNVGIYNKICSNEPVPLKKLYHNRTTAVLNTVTVFAMNKLLGFTSAGAEGLSRRLHVLPFNHKPKKRDPFLKDNLAQELEGIFAWCWGLSFNQTFEVLQWRIEDEIKKVYQNQITEILFLEENYSDGIASISASELYVDYSDWCLKYGYKAQNAYNFYNSLKRVKGIHKHRMSKGVFYAIPPMGQYTDCEMIVDALSPTEVIYGITSSEQLVEPLSDKDSVGVYELEENNKDLIENYSPVTEENSSPPIHPYTSQTESELVAEDSVIKTNNKQSQEKVEPDVSTLIDFRETCRRINEMLKMRGHRTKEARKGWFEVFLRQEKIDSFNDISKVNIARAYVYLCELTNMYELMEPTTVTLPLKGVEN